MAYKVFLQKNLPTFLKNGKRTSRRPPPPMRRNFHSTNSPPFSTALPLQNAKRCRTIIISKNAVTEGSPCLS